MAFLLVRTIVRTLGGKVNLRDSLIYENIVLEREAGGKIAVVKMNRPEALNARNRQMLDELVQVFERLRQSLEVKAVVLTGADGNFSAGADIKEFQFDCFHAKEITDKTLGLYRTIEMMPKPVVAAVNGFALGGGMELVLASDVCLASPEAKFGLPEINLGLIPAYGLSRLPAAVGASRAKEILLSGRIITASEALDFGLVHKIVPSERLVEVAVSLAADLADKAPLAVMAIKEALSNFMAVPFGYSAAQILWLFSSQDAQEARKAFSEKRKPLFRGL